MNILDDITLVMITYSRNQCCIKVINSWLQNIPNLKIILIDTNGTNSTLSIKHDKLRHIKTQFNIQPSLARNIGIQCVDTEYLFMSDDDDFAPSHISIMECLKYMKQHNYVDILGIRPRLMTVKNNVLKISKIIKNTSFMKCDSVANYFIARKDTVPYYDTNILFPYEHWDFFLSSKQTNKNVYAHSLFSLNSVKSRYSNRTYNKTKKRQCNSEICKNLFYQKWKITTVSYE